MTKYLLGRIVRGLLSVILVVTIVMILIYTCMNRELIFKSDPVFSKKKGNEKEVYMMQQWELYGYLDYVSYSDFLGELLASGEIDKDEYAVAVKIANESSGDSAITKKYVRLFQNKYKNELGYEVERLKGDSAAGGRPALYAYKDIPITTRLWEYISGLISIDNIHYVKEDIENRGLTFTLFDPAYGGEKFSPAIMGNGTRHKYLLYFDDTFPYIHQNLVSVNLGKSYTVSKGIDVFDDMTRPQGPLVYSTVYYPTGLAERRADNLHTATYIKGSLAASEPLSKFFVDDYTNVATSKSGLSRIGYSFIIGLISVILAYVLAIPLGTLMALKKDKFVDKLGTAYIVFIIAVPSLAYIFLFKAIGAGMGLSTTFDELNPHPEMYILPIVSLALPSVANLMKWLRRYMIDQMNSDYVKFARSGGLSEGEIFSKHVLKNAIIPIVHGIPGSVLGSLVGAIITERVYVVPGTGNLLTKAINMYDNGAIVGVTLFYALLSVVSIILGDIFMSLVDPRISFSSKAR